MSGEAREHDLTRAEELEILAAASPRFPAQWIRAALVCQSQGRLNDAAKLGRSLSKKAELRLPALLLAFLSAEWRLGGYVAIGRPQILRTGEDGYTGELGPFTVKIHDTGHGPDDDLDQEKPEEIILELTAAPKGLRYYHFMLTTWTRASRPRKGVMGVVAVLMHEIEQHLGYKVAGKFKRLPYHVA